MASSKASLLRILSSLSEQSEFTESLPPPSSLCMFHGVEGAFLGTLADVAGVG